MRGHSLPSTSIPNPRRAGRNLANESSCLPGLQETTDRWFTRFGMRGLHSIGQSRLPSRFSWRHSPFPVRFDFTGLHVFNVRACGETLTHFSAHCLLDRRIVLDGLILLNMNLYGSARRSFCRLHRPPLGHIFCFTARTGTMDCSTLAAV